MSHLNELNLTKKRLIDAVLDLWTDVPAENISVRTVVHRAGAAQAAIHYHFGNIERLYAAASQTALTQAQEWMETRLNALADLAGAGLPWQLQASVLASTIDDWTTRQRRLAMAARYVPGAQWQAAWDDFWSRLCGLLKLDAHAATIAFFATGETARHLLVWRPALDRALLEETAAALLLWLNDQQLVDDPIRTKYQELAGGGYDRPPPRDDVLASKIEQAAADLLAETGHSGVTFRAVAGRAEVTLGKVIHVCGVKSELLRRALHRLYEREALKGNREQFVARTFPPDVIRGRLMVAIMAAEQPVLRAYDEIERAIYIGDEYAALRGVVRSMDDPSGTWALEQMLGGITPPGALVAAFSAVIRGIGYRVHSEPPDAEFARLVNATMAVFQHRAL